MRKPLKRLAIVPLMLVIIGYGAYQLLPPSAAGRVAVTQPAKIDRFSFGPTGAAGSIPERENCFFTILSSRHSARLFRDLFDQGTTEAKLYALVGLHLTGNRGFRECAACFTKESSRVQTQGGCIASDCTTAEAVAAIERGEVERYLTFRTEHVRAR